MQVTTAKHFNLTQNAPLTPRSPAGPTMMSARHSLLLRKRLV
jgi:hypothetical protein